MAGSFNNPAWRASGSVANGAAGTLTLTAPSLVADDVMIAVVNQASNVAITAPGGWTSFTQQNNTAGMTSRIFYKRAVTADSGNTFAFTVDAAANNSGCIHAFSGVDWNTTVPVSTPVYTITGSNTDAVTIPTNTSNTSFGGLWIGICIYNNTGGTGSFSTCTGTSVSPTVRQSAAGTATLFGLFTGSKTDSSASGVGTAATTSTTDTINIGASMFLNANMQPAQAVSAPSSSPRCGYGPGRLPQQ